VTVATIGLDGFPKSRVVLLKFTEEGFIYTNYNSEKARRLKRTSNMSFFFWHSMERQVIIKGLPKNQKSFLIIILIQDQKEVS
jgi:pyridoxamine 5'-phosphate oxidase